MPGGFLVPTGKGEELFDETLLMKRKDLEETGRKGDPCLYVIRTVYDLLRPYLSVESVVAEYKNLRRYLENNRMFTQASGLYIREMRLSRKLIPKWNLAERIAHILYDGISDYGESIGRPILLLAFLIFLGGLIINYMAMSPITLGSLLKCIKIAASVAFQLRSFQDIRIDKSTILTDMIPLNFEILFRIIALIIMGNIFTALRHRLERR